MKVIAFLKAHVPADLSPTGGRRAVSCHHPFPSHLRQKIIAEAVKEGRVHQEE
jgi:hypothetical protein